MRKVTISYEAYQDGGGGVIVADGLSSLSFMRLVLYDTIISAVLFPGLPDFAGFFLRGFE